MRHGTCICVYVKYKGTLAYKISLHFILKGIFSVGNVAGGGGSTLTVNFSDIGTNAYMVVGTLVSKGNDWNQDNDVMFVIREKTSTSFKILLREVAGATQNLEFEYALIPL